MAASSMATSSVVAAAEPARPVAAMTVACAAQAGVKSSAAADGASVGALGGGVGVSMGVGVAWVGALGVGVPAAGPRMGSDAAGAGGVLARGVGGVRA